MNRLLTIIVSLAAMTAFDGPLLVSKTIRWWARGRSYPCAMSFLPDADGNTKTPSPADARSNAFLDAGYTSGEPTLTMSPSGRCCRKKISRGSASNIDSR